MKKVLTPIFIILPIIMMLGWVATLSLPSIFGTEVRLKIQGYDPRDLLSGNYLQYQINYDIPPFCTNTPNDLAEKCVCLNEAPNKSINKVTWVGNCNERPENCAIYLSGNCQNSRFITGIERFYIPEKLKITTTPENSTVVLKILNGKAIVQDIEVKGTSLLNQTPKE